MDNGMDLVHYQWLTAMQSIEMSAVESARMMYWCREPRKEQEPDLVLMIALWAQADDTSLQLENDALVIDSDEFMSIEDIKTEVAMQEGFMMGSEKHQPRIYPDLINKQLVERTDAFGRMISQYAESQEPEELDELLDERDLLEYARMGLNVIRMEGRLPTVEYDSFAARLKQLDTQLKEAIPNDAEIFKPPYVPSTFWWRK